MNKKVLKQKYSRKSKKSLKLKKRNNKHKKRTLKKKYRGGVPGYWVKPSEDIITENPTCPICLGEFRETPNKAIYETECGHIFHNNCLIPYCDRHNGEPNCPICRKKIEWYECTNVDAFKTKALGSPDKAEGEPYFDDAELQNIYVNQE